MLIGIAATVDFSNTITTEQQTQAAADSAAVAATTAMVNSLTSGHAITAAQAQTIASNFFKTNAPAQAIAAQTTFSATTTNVNGLVSTAISYSGAPVSMIGGFVGSSATFNVASISASTVRTVVTPATGQVNGTGWVAEDPVVKGADGSWNMDVCDISHKTWYNLVSDSQFEVNANCDGTFYEAELYQFEVLAGTHTIFVTPTLQRTSWCYGGDCVNREVWMGDVTIDGQYYPAIAGTSTYLNDTANNIKAQVFVGAPNASGSSANYVLITTPNYNVSLAYDSDDDGSWNFGLADFEISVTNAGACGALGGVWGRTTANVDDTDWTHFIVASATSTASQFSVNCSTSTTTATVAKMTK